MKYENEDIKDSMEDLRSHTLVFVQDNYEEAKNVVELMKAQCIAIDYREEFVRIGFGLNHNPEDIDRFIAAISPIAVSIK